MLLLSSTLALAGLGTLGGAVASRPAPDDARDPDRTARSAGRGGDLTDWVGVLESLDAARAQAYRDGDPSALVRVYTSGSEALREDRRLLRRYVERGLRVVGLRMQVVDLRLVERGPRRVELRVRDQVSGGAVVDREGQATALPPDPLSRHRITLVRSGDGWRIARLVAQG